MCTILYILKWLRQSKLKRTKQRKNNRNPLNLCYEFKPQISVDKYASTSPSSETGSVSPVSDLSRERCGGAGNVYLVDWVEIEGWWPERVGVGRLVVEGERHGIPVSGLRFGGVFER